MNRHTLIAFALIVPLGVALGPSTARAQAPDFLNQWGSYGTGSGQFETPVGVAVAPDGVVYVIDSNLGKLQAFTRAGTLIAQWSCVGATGIAVDASTVYVVGGDSFRRFTRAGSLISQRTLIAVAIAVDSFGYVYVTGGTSGVRKLTNNGDALISWGPQGTGNGQFSNPNGIALDALGNVYVTDASSSSPRVEVFSNIGVYLSQWGSPGTGAGQFDTPTRLVVTPGGSVVVVDDFNNRIQAFTESGSFLWQLGSAGSGPGQFANPVGIGVDGDGNIYVADTNNSRIQVFGYGATPTKTQTWGHLKALYR